MNERVVQFRVGVMVLATVFITAIMVVLFDGFPNLVEGPYTLYVDFPEAPGISIGTPVRKSGILIGRVSKVQFAEDLDPKLEGVVITVQIDNNRRVRRNEIPQIAKSLLGDAFIEFVPGRRRTRPGPPMPADSAEFLNAGEMVEGEAPSDPFAALANLQTGMASTMQSIAETSDEIGNLSRRVNSLLRSNDQQLVRIVNKAELALDSIHETAKNANQLLGDPMVRDNILKTAADLPKVLESMTQALDSLQDTFMAANRNFSNLEGLTKPLGARGPQLVSSLEQAVGNINVLSRDLRMFSTMINNNQGTLGQLINDPALYQQVSQTVAKVNCILNEVQPIVRNVKVLSDKVSRHPEVLGVRGAIKPSSGIQ
jgi:phospholipid/cholesterol/gamma-HCH transport system substrate-binding protein